MTYDEVIGAVGLASMVIRPSDTSVVQAHNDLATLDPTSITNLIEGACTAALAEHFAPGETSVTRELVLNVSGTVGVGAEIRAHATCVNMDNSILDFSIEIHHGSRLIATASLTRKVVDRISYMARIAAESVMSEAG
jgi:predicted thioesterase